MMMFYAVFLQFVGFVQAVVNEWGLIHFRRNEQNIDECLLTPPFNSYMYHPNHNILILNSQLLQYIRY